MTLQLSTLCCTISCFCKKTLISNNSLMRTLFCSNMVNLKMCPRFRPNKPMHSNLHNRGEFEGVCTFLIKHSHLSKFTIARTLFNNFKLFNKSRQFQAKRQLHRVFWRQFRATGKLCTAFFTGLGFLTIRANFKQNDSCAQCFDANFEQQESCARCFGQVLAL